ncbi:MAG: NADH-quinone oxidoreductase subunit C [Elusimicrobia bacterium]|nr:NADH-quinone oxidoreductase subunit C [Elusimicrobiota bacterium]
MAAMTVTSAPMTKEELKAELEKTFPDLLPAKASVGDYLTLRLPDSAKLLPVVRHLKDKLGFDYLDMVNATDWLGPVSLAGFIREPNFNIFLPEGANPQAEPPAKTAGVDYRDAIELSWCLSNLARRIKLFLKLDVPRAGGKAPSLISLYKAADWQERELFDLYGVRFDGHPNMTKILTPDFTVGHPLLKDYIHQKDRFD